MKFQTINLILNWNEVVFLYHIKTTIQLLQNFAELKT